MPFNTFQNEPAFEGDGIHVANVDAAIGAANAAHRPFAMDPSLLLKILVEFQELLCLGLDIHIYSFTDYSRSQALGLLQR